MKKTILTAAIISAFLISCNETKNKEVSSDAMDTIEEVHEHHTSTPLSNQELMAAINNDWVNEINLDNGDKWDANIETNQGVEKMLSLVEASEKKSVEDYHALASDLNETKNFVVKKCTMEGASHDNLHVFLHPLIDKIAALGKVSSVDQGSEITASIKENLEGYSNYFK